MYSGGSDILGLLADLRSAGGSGTALGTCQAKTLTNMSIQGLREDPGKRATSAVCAVVCFVILMSRGKDASAEEVHGKSNQSPAQRAGCNSSIDDVRHAQWPQLEGGCFPGHRSRVALGEGPARCQAGDAMLLR